MTIGTAIFLSVAVLGIVILFRATRDRWRWKLIAIVSASIAVTAPLALWGAFSIYDYWQNRPTPQDTFGGVKLGQTEADVLFLKGRPDAGESSKSNWVYKTDGDGTSTEYKIVFRDGHITKILAASYDPSVSVGGVSIGEKIDDVINRLGQPNHIETSTDGLRRLFSYKKYNIAVGAAQGIVQCIVIFKDSDWVSFSNKTADNSGLDGPWSDFKSLQPMTFPGSNNPLTYTIRAPNGKTYWIKGPAGASQDQIEAEIERQDPNAVMVTSSNQ